MEHEGDHTPPPSAKARKKGAIPLLYHLSALSSEHQGQLCLYPLPCILLLDVTIITCTIYYFSIK
jgi:hypothetical protein